MSTQHSKDAFTLVEMLIAVSVAGIAGALLIQLFVQSNGLYHDQSTTVKHGLALNTATPKIESDIKSAAGVATNYQSYTTSVDTLVLKIPSIDNSGGVIDQTYDYLVYYKDQTNPKLFRRTVYPTSPSVRLASNEILFNDLLGVTFLYFDKNGSLVSPISAEKINFTLNVANDYALSTKESSASSEVSLRND